MSLRETTKAGLDFFFIKSVRDLGSNSVYSETIHFIENIQKRMFCFEISYLENN
jgi:hypothetical protein